MKIVERGEGLPLVLIPGIQGRWEYVQLAVEALSAAFRVMTFSLRDEPSARADGDDAGGIDGYVDQVYRALEACAVDRAIVCGISFGGRVALRFAACHPDRTAGLVLVSTPGPVWFLRKRHEVYARFPRLLGLLFLAETPWRLRLEVGAAFSTRSSRWQFVRSQLATLARAPVSSPRMALRARMMAGMDVAADCARVTAPTLVITGERGLDHVVPVDESIGYLSMIRGAEGVMLQRTGHLGSITRPKEFAALVSDFAARLAPRRNNRPEVA